MGVGDTVESPTSFFIMTRRTPISFRIGPLPILAIAIATLYFAHEILIPLAFALTLTLILSPPVSWLNKIHVSRPPAVLIVILSFVGSAAGLAWVIGNQLIEVANELPDYRHNIHDKFQAIRAPTKGTLGRAAESIQELGKELSSADPAPAVGGSLPVRPAKPGAPTQISPTQINRPLPVEVVEPPRNGLQYARDLIKPFIAPLGITGIVLIFTVFMLAKKEDLRDRFLRLVGLGQLNVVTKALDDATNRVSRYLLTQFVVNAAFGLLVGLGLYFIGVPYAVLWGAVAGLLRLVPYIGALVGLTLPLILSLAVFDRWTPPLLVLGLGVCLEVITANLVEPWLYGANTGISSLAILVAAVFWTILWGYAGLILSTPLTVCLLVLGRHVPQLSFLHVLLGDEPVLEPQAQLYQRLLAMDQTEARSVVDGFLREHPLVELYDSVLVPALTMAEQDRHRGEIDATREEFLFLSLNEMVAEFSGYRPASQPMNAENVADESTLSKIRPAQMRSRQIHSCEIRPRNARILCVPAHDQADEVAAAMLAQLLEQQGDVALSFLVGTDFNETIAVVKPGPQDLICISALPPYAFTPARKICKQLRARFPQVEVTVGVWGFSGDQDKAKISFERTQPDRLFTSFLQVVEYIRPPMREKVEPTLVGSTFSAG
jgi:predicted PurR-regulated permease PerM